VAVLGATGSIGTKALAVAGRYPDRIRLTALAAGTDAERLAALGREFDVRRLVLGDPAGLGRLRTAAAPGTTVEAGAEAVAALAVREDVDLVINGIVGRVGLEASLAAVGAGKPLGLANKESLVLAGPLLMETAAHTGAVVLPIDSEHSGLFQALQGRAAGEVAGLRVTASGGPFRGYDRHRLAGVTPEEALNHPIWPMGPRITVDSATLFNKGLEVIETHHLFQVPLERIGVWVHPQSVVHAVVELVDGSILAQLSAPDMLLPVQYAMSYPERWAAEAPGCRLPDWKSLTFEEVDRETFPALDLAYRAGRAGGTAPTVLNAADEVAVDAFLGGRIAFPEIAAVVEKTLDRLDPSPADSLESIAAADTEARALARETVEGRTS